MPRQRRPPQGRRPTTHAGSVFPMAHIPPDAVYHLAGLVWLGTEAGLDQRYARFTGLAEIRIRRHHGTVIGNRRARGRPVIARTGIRKEDGPRQGDAADL